MVLFLCPLSWSDLLGSALDARLTHCVRSSSTSTGWRADSESLCWSRGTSHSMLTTVTALEAATDSLCQERPTLTSVDIMGGSYAVFPTIGRDAVVTLSNLFNLVII